MRTITEHVYRVGSAGCDIYLIDTDSKDGLILIDCGMDIEIINDITDKGFAIEHINHCILTHFHIDHICACHVLYEINEKVKFYAHKLDAIPIEEKGYDHKTAASWYGKNYIPIRLYQKFNKSIEVLNLGAYKVECIHTPGHTPGSISVFIEIDNKKILFGQDIHGPFSKAFDSNLHDYQKSMKTLLNLEADILCEGHYGIIQPQHKVREYIKSYMIENQP